MSKIFLVNYKNILEKKNPKKAKIETDLEKYAAGEEDRKLL